MNESAGSLGILRNLDSYEVVLVVSVLVLAWLLASAVRWVLRSAAEGAPVRLRLPILRVIPLLRLCIGVGAFVAIVPLIVEPSFQNIVAIVASVGLALAFVLKDYASSLVAGLVTVLEGPYQPGDADFYLHPDHDAQAVSQRLVDVANASSYLMPGTKVGVVVQEKPWGTHYKLKAYVKESREQFEFLTDLTTRGKEALRAMDIRFAQTPYAAVDRGGER